MAVTTKVALCELVLNSQLYLAKFFAEILEIHSQEYVLVPNYFIYASYFSFSLLNKCRLCDNRNSNDTFKVILSHSMKHCYLNY